MDTYVWDSNQQQMGVGPKLPPPKVNILDTTALQFPTDYIMQKIKKRVHHHDSIDGGASNDDDYNPAFDFDTYEEELQ